MGNSLPKSDFTVDFPNAIAFVIESKITVHHVSNGGCLAELGKAMGACNPGYVEQRKRGTLGTERVVVDKEACVKATAALRKCFARNPTMFKHHYLSRMDEGLDQDLNPSPEEIKKQSVSTYRWWTGMRRS
ncbi:unnamed protein product [Alopecurus aequalis]